MPSGIPNSEYEYNHVENGLMFMYEWCYLLPSSLCVLYTNIYCSISAAASDGRGEGGGRVGRVKLFIISCIAAPRGGKRTGCCLLQTAAAAGLTLVVLMGSAVSAAHVALPIVAILHQSSHSLYIFPLYLRQCLNHFSSAFCIALSTIQRLYQGQGNEYECRKSPTRDYIE